MEVGLGRAAGVFARPIRGVEPASNEEVERPQALHLTSFLDRPSPLRSRFAFPASSREGIDARTIRDAEIGTSATRGPWRPGGLGSGFSSPPQGRPSRLRKFNIIIDRLSQY